VYIPSTRDKKTLLSYRIWQGSQRKLCLGCVYFTIWNRSLNFRSKMTAVDDRKVNEPYFWGQTLQYVFPLLRWSSRCLPRYFGIPRLIYGSRNDISFVMKLVNIILLILTAFLFYLCNKKSHFYFMGCWRKFMFLRKSFTDVKNFRTILFCFLISCIRLRRFISYVN